MATEEGMLIREAKADPDAFGRLYERHVADIYRFVHARLPNVAAAEDVTANVFFKALRGIRGYQDRGRPFSCWLYRIAEHAVADYYRHEPQLRELSDSLPVGGRSVEARAMSHLEAAEVWRLVGRLPGPQRQAMLLRFRDDLSAREAAAIMGKSEAAVKLLIYRAVGRLRSQLAPVEPGPLALVANEC
jgi:RNA polymerase sigma-70 factor (ECF subfamily)